MSKSEIPLQTVAKSIKEAKILKSLTAMAERLELSSVEAILLFAGANFWLNDKWALASLRVLEKLAAAKQLDLREDIPYVLQLVEHDVIKPEEGVLFGVVRKKEEGMAKGQEAGQANPAAASANGKRTRRAVQH